MTLEEFEGWLANPVTREFREYLKTRASVLARQWAQGDFVDNAETQQIVAQTHLQIASTTHADIVETQEFDSADPE